MNWEQIAQVLGSALGLLSQVINKHGNEETKNALKLLESVLNAITYNDLQNLDPLKAQAELDNLVKTLINTDAKIDDLLKEKFRDK